MTQPILNMSMDVMVCFCELYEWKKKREKACFLPLCFLFLSGWRSKDTKDGEGWRIASNGSVFKKRAQNNIDGPLDAPASRAISWSELLSQPRKRKQKAIEDYSKPKHQLNLTSDAKMKTSRTTNVKKSADWIFMMINL